jgi:hypothetical protein
MVASRPFGSKSSRFRETSCATVTIVSAPFRGWSRAASVSGAVDQSQPLRLNHQYDPTAEAAITASVSG